MPITTETSQEPIPGYRILERIGAGGYGEVWKAEAPGGLVKALKFVYGRLDEERASREMKSLERIKDVRHPFLLSLERIEVADGRLMIVTELAEGSLKDRFDEVRAEGRSGIDREELLTYMRDAADVLDYMSESHSLQHLDIKPENLLLVGGRIKVADFGLVKKLQDVTASLLGGLTPLYAPPELFEGRPSAFSDQYSLAIVYVEMFTGTLPFAGRTAAQLAKQHLHAAPKLGSLPQGEQAVLRRALAKRPEDRFPSCREFVRALTSAPDDSALSAGGASSPGSAESQAVTEPQAATGRYAARSDSSGVPRTQTGCPRRRVPQVRSEPCRDAGPLEVPSAVPILRPTLWIGFGGAGIRVVAELRRRHLDRMGADHLPQCWQYMMVDTDVNDLARIGSAISSSGARVDPVIAMPLRRPQEYKGGRANHARWLSRRWLYHIPKVPATSGLRPLGCLAFTDHTEEFEIRLSSMLHSICADESIAAAEQATGWQCENRAPHVVLVSGLGGGTGGGAFVEAALTVRRVFHAEGFAEGSLTASLLHASPRTPQDRELAIVSSYAALTEIYHAQSASPQSRPFDEIYLDYCGDGLLDGDYEQALRRFAGKLALESTTLAGRLKQLAAEHDRAEQGSPQVAIRAAGVHAIGPHHGNLIDLASRRLASSVVQSWLTGDAPEMERESSLLDRVTCTATVTGSTHDTEKTSSEVTKWIDAHWRQLELAPEQVAARCAAAVGEALESDVESFLRQQILQLRDSLEQREDMSAWVSASLSVLARMFGAEPSDTDLTLSREPGVLEPFVDRHRREFVDSVGAALVADLTEAASQPEWRVAGAHAMVQHLRVCLRRASDAIREQLGVAKAEAANAKAILALAEESTGKSKRKPLSEEGTLAAIEQLALAEWHQFRCQFCIDSYAAIDGVLAEAYDELVNVSRELRAVSDFVEPPVSTGIKESTEPYVVACRRHLAERAHELAEELEAGVRKVLDSYGVSGAWVGLIQQDANGRGVLADLLLNQSRELVGRTLEQCDILGDATSNDTEAMANQLDKWFRSSGEAAELWGGVRRRYVIVPDANKMGAWMEAYYGHEHNLPSVLEGSAVEIVFGTEVGAIPITRVGVALIGARSDRVEYANRLLSRSDVEYRPLPDESFDE